jgi:GMP synthase (glutamine-hydrolysing)
MNDILIIKTGTGLPSLAARGGDFEDWILDGMRLPGDRATVAEVWCGAPLPAYDSIAGIVITGSVDMVTAHEEWSERTAAWLPGAVERGIPILGICYGHQLLAYALGGEVGDNPTGLEYGCVDVTLTEHAETDPLLGGMGTTLQVQVCHDQSVVRLPGGATVLASNAMDPYQAFVVGGNAWGVQFHPEFDAATVAICIKESRDALVRQGSDPDRLLETCVDTSVGPEILRRFAGIAAKRLLGCCDVGGASHHRSRK